MQTLTANYDNRNDILYLRMSSEEPLFGEEDDNGILTYFGMNTNRVRGVAIFDFGKRLDAGVLNNSVIPIDIDVFSPQIVSLVKNPGKGYRVIIPC